MKKYLFRFVFFLILQNSFGQCTLTIVQKGGNIAELSAGLYLYTITSGNDVVYRGKIMVRR